MAGLVTRILYRLRFAAEQRPLDAVTLAFSLPLILMLVGGKRIEGTSSEDQEEQLLLALEFLASHSGSCKLAIQPRVKPKAKKGKKWHNDY